MIKCNEIALFKKKRERENVNANIGWKIYI